MRSYDQNILVCVIALLGVQAGLLAWSATHNSPTLDEPAHLVAGLRHWKYGAFDVYSVNPPLVHYVAALPVICAGYIEAEIEPGLNSEPRVEFKLGEDFVRANGFRSLWLFTIARWACIPLTLMGGIFGYLWSRELWGNHLAGLITLCFWTFEPNILAHGQLITCDVAASAFGLGATYLFWRWLEKPSWGRAFAAGTVTGLTLLTKTSWVILLGVWPALWLVWQLLQLRHSQHRSEQEAHSQSGHLFLQLTTLIIIAICVLNLGYRCDGSFTAVKDFRFVSQSLSGQKTPGMAGNRFSNSWIGEIPVPFPIPYVLGIDLQKKDFEGSSYESYLRGEWKSGGWLHYYVYGLVVKTPHGSQAILLLAIFTWFYLLWQRKSKQVDLDRSPARRDGQDLRSIVVLLTPPLALLTLVSSQLGFNQHLRYVLPIYGFAYVFAGITTIWFEPFPRRQIGAREGGGD
jgi:hypothetical protein